MAKRIITISREFGSGGRFMGKEVAKNLVLYFLQSLFFSRKVKYDTKEERRLTAEELGNIRKICEVNKRYVECEKC